MSELEKLLANLPPLSEGQEQPSWLQDLITYLKTQEGVIMQLEQDLMDLRPLKKEPLPALDLDTLGTKAEVAPEAKGIGFQELELSEEEITAQAQRETQAHPGQTSVEPEAAMPVEDSIFEDPDEIDDEPPPVDKKYIVAVDRDLADLIPQFLSARQKEADDFSLWLRMDEFEKVAQTCKAAKGVVMTLGFDYLGKLLKAISQQALLKNRAAAEKILFEINFFIDQCRIEYQ